MKIESGITLVSLVVTIIILIILAGISINTLVGDNGIIIKAQEAKENTLLAQEEESKQFNQLYSQWNYIEGNTGNVDEEILDKLSNFKKAIATAISNEGVATQETDEVEVMTRNIGKIVQEKTKDATAKVEDIIWGKTAWVNGNQVTGTREENHNIIKLEPISNYTYDVSKYTGYKEYTIEDFIVEINDYHMEGYSVGSTDGSRTIRDITMTKSYDSETGILEIGNTYEGIGATGKWWLGINLRINVYLIK